VLKYLARYVYRTGISNGRLLRLEGDQVTFSYRDYHEPDSPEKQMTLSADQFLGRFLQHVLPKGLMGVRHFGFLGGPRVAQRLERLRKLIAASAGQQASAAPPAEHTTQSCSPEHDSVPGFAGAPSICPECGKGPMREIGEGPRRVCEEVRKLVWDVFPPWLLQVKDSS
jgi:hypothetical protein